MCYILITLNPKSKTTQTASILTAKQEYNPDGVALLNPLTNSLYRGLTLDKTELLKLAQARMSIAHLRMATEGAVNENNVHLWNHNGVYFAHNGTVYGKATNGKTDSETFFNLIIANGLADKASIDTEQIAKLAKKQGVWGRFVITIDNFSYLFGDWKAYLLDGIVYIASQQTTLAEYYLGIPFEKAREAALDGVYEIDHVTGMLEYVHEYKDATEWYDYNNYYGYHNKKNAIGYR